MGADKRFGMKPGGPGPWILVLLLMVLVSSLATELSLYSRNTLEQHPEWELSNLSQAYPSMGAEPARRTRNLLYQNKLNLEVWHGYQEVLFHQPLRPQILSFDLYLGKDGLLTVWYALEAEKAEGLRLSRHDELSGARLTKSREGEFLAVESLSCADLSDRWYRVELCFEESEVVVRLDDEKAASLPPIPDKPVAIGFSGEAQQVLVDNVHLVDKNGRLLLEENFRNRGFLHLWSRLATLWFLVCAVLLLLIKANGRPWRDTVLRVALLNFTALGVLVLAWVFDYRLWSKVYAFDGVTPWNRYAKFSRAEQARVDLFAPLQDWDLNTVPSEPPVREFLKLSMEREAKEGIKYISAETFPHSYHRDSEIDKISRKGPNSLRIALIGSSQTFGEGAVDLDKTLGTYLYRSLVQATNKDIEVFNCAWKGTESSRLLRRFEELAPVIEPDFVVLNLSNNDQGNSKKFRENVLEFIALARRLGAQVLLVHEPNSPQLSSYIHKNHEVLTELSAKEVVPLLPLHAELQEYEAKGRLWWDVVHLTSYGQRIAAEKMAEAIVGNRDFPTRKSE